MKAAILETIGQPLTVARVESSVPTFGQVLVRVLVSGICGAQLQEIDGLKGDPKHLPRLLGHEGVGIVVNVGPSATKFQIGDKVVMHWRKGSGAEAPVPIYRWENGVVMAGPITTFNELAVVSENRLTKVPEDAPNELCALLGCGLSTALMTIEHEANLKMGERVLIVGCGGLGLNLIRAAKMRRAGIIIGVDVNYKKMDTCLGAGADDYVCIQDWHEADECDVIIDTSGDRCSIGQALRFLAPSGRFIMVGQPEGDVTIHGARHLFAGEGKIIKATQGGGFNPSQDIPRYVRLWESGQLNLDGIVTHRVPLDEINDGIALVRNGQAGRVLIEMP